ncbi:Agglutinin domain-containing protein [Dioscorea alata]|uniref:Agglutinin domain-containing protein n=2 Tax=Dioscorea alata TaxID=55571 RepID=A0ACB7V9K6_DIOAL|nr:Agglutinin domain-containing protein [Dioscorea alata]KAH7670231.1 Agglutinin domain-containing protein [Dioscorea alata]
MALVLPRFIVINFNHKDKKDDKRHYMGYINEEGKEYKGYLAFTETQAVSAYGKFEVETADRNGLVHIRSCQNNKYWVRTKENDNRGDLAWIAATAEKPENDQCKESCTLFKFIIEEAAIDTYRIVHIQSGCYLSSKRRPASNFARFVVANDKTCEENENGIFKLIDWDSLVILPKYLTFKGDNGQYLCLRQIEGHPYLQFSTDDIGDSTAVFENFTTEDGTICIKSTSNNQFWRLSPNWIWADSNENSNNNKDTLFHPIKVDYQTIGLLNLGNNHFCKSLTTEGKTNCLNADVPSVTKEAKLKVEEPVLTRNIYDVKYDMENSRVYGETVLALAKNSAINNTLQTSSLDVKLSYTNTKTSNWKTMLSLKLGMKATVDFSIPLIFDGKIEISGEVHSGVEWGETTTTTTVLEVVNKVVVAPMSKVTIFLIATHGKCDVPFTFMQKDTLYNGNTVTTEVQGGTYTGSNYYSIKFETEQEKI